MLEDCHGDSDKQWDMREGVWSVQRSPAVGGPTETRDLFVLDGELVVVCDLLPQCDVPLGVDDNLFLHPKTDDLRIAVGLREEKSTQLTHTHTESFSFSHTLANIHTLTSQQWLMNRAMFPFLVASMM